MLGTILSVLVAAYLIITDNPPNPAFLQNFFVGFSALLFLGGLLLFAGAYSALQKGEQNSIPKLIQLVREDIQLQAALIFTLILPLLTLLPLFERLFPIAIILLGIGIDSLRRILYRILDHLNPFKIVEFLKKDIKEAISKDRDAELCETIDSLSDLSIRAIFRHNSALANQAIDALEDTGELFLRAEKSISRPVQTPDLKQEGVKDTLSFVLIYLLQNLEGLFMQALDKRMEFVLGHLITTYVKLTAFSAKTDLSLAIYPLHYTGKLTQESLEKGFSDIGNKATAGLVEVAKTIPQLKDIAYLDIKPFFITLVTILDNTAKGLFKHDKATNIAVLTSPFFTLRTLFETEPLKSHQDARTVVIQIDKVIAEFQALDNLLKTMPPLPNLSEALEKG
jgi:hypothetical protein